MKRLVFILITVFGFITLTQISAQTKASQGRYPGFGSGLMEELKLTDAQLSSINDIRYKHQEAMIELRSQIQKNRLEMSKLIAGDEINTSAVMELTDQNSALQAKINKSRVTMWTDIYKLLDTDQKKIWSKGFNRMGRGFGINRPGRGFRGDGNRRFFDRDDRPGNRPMRNRDRIDWDY